MTHFKGTLSGKLRRSETVSGSRSSGIAAVLSSVQGIVLTTLYREGDTDYLLVTVAPVIGGSPGNSVVIYRGPLASAAKPFPKLRRARAN